MVEVRGFEPWLLPCEGMQPLFPYLPYQGKCPKPPTTSCLSTIQGCAAFMIVSHSCADQTRTNIRVGNGCVGADPQIGQTLARAAVSAINADLESPFGRWLLEPTRNAWVPLAAWFRRQGAVVVMVPSEQSADLRDYFSKHTKTDRLDAQLLARLPVLHPEGLHPVEALGPGDPLKRAVKIRAGLVHRRSAAMHRLDSLLEILGPGWVEALGSDMTQTAFRFLATYANPHQVKRLGRARLTRWFQHHTRKAWGSGRADLVVAAAEETLALWGHDGLDFEALAADIAREATLALELSEQIALLERRIHDLYCEADPDGIVRSAPGVGDILAAQILGRLGDPHRFTSLAAARSFTGLVPRRNASGLADHAGGPTKQGDACLRAALFMAADHARKDRPSARRPLPEAHQ